MRRAWLVIGGAGLGCAGLPSVPTEIIVHYGSDLRVAVNRGCDPMPGLQGTVGGVPMTLIEVGHEVPVAMGVGCVPPELRLAAAEAGAVPPGPTEVVLTDGADRWVVSVESAVMPRLDVEWEGDTLRLRPTPATMRPPGSEARIRWNAPNGEGCSARADNRPDPADGWRVRPPGDLCPGEVTLTVDDRTRQSPERCPDGVTCRQMGLHLRATFTLPYPSESADEP